MDNSQLYQLYLQELARQQAEQNRGSSLGNAKNYAKKIGNYGNKLSVVGDAIKDNINNEVAKKIGTSMSNIGGTLQNGANSATNILDKPANYFRGFAGQGLQNIGTKLGTQGGAIGTLGNGISSLGTTVAGGTGAGAATGAAAAGSAGTAAGTAGTVGGLTTAGTAGAAGAGAAGGAAAGGAAGSGAAAGGAAAGGSAAGGAAAAGPIGALIALGIMALQGTNRKRAKQSGQALMQQTNQMAEMGNEEADQRLALTQQNSAALQQQAQNALQNGLMTGGAAPVKERSPIEEYQDYLRGAGYSDDIVRGVPQGLNGGNKEIASWIDQYNAGAGKNNPINIPQTDEEIAAAKAGTFNNMQTGNVAQNEQIKRGLLDKFISGISDFSRGYDENRNTAFSPSNLQSKANIDDFKANINPADYTTKLSDAEQKQFDNWASDMKAKGIINPNDNFQDYDMQGYWKNEVLNNTNLANGNAENHFTDKYKMPNHKTFSNESIYAKGDNARYAGKWDSNGNYIAPVNNGKMARLGEAMGTIGRMVNKPGVQALLAGGISTALTGNPLYGVGMAAKYGGNRAMSDIYQNALAKQGVQANPGMFGALTSTDMDSLMRPQYKAVEQQMANELLQERIRHNQEIEAIRQQMANTNEYRAKNGTTVTHVSTGGGAGTGKGGRTSPTTTTSSDSFVIMEAPNGKRYKVPENQIKKYKQAGGKIVG